MLFTQKYILFILQNSIGSPSPTAPRAPRDIPIHSPSDDGTGSIFDDGSEGSSIVDGGPMTVSLSRCFSFLKTKYS